MLNLRPYLTPELLKPGHTGHCYHASEALWHLWGGYPWVPQIIKHEGDTHWYLKNKVTGEIADPTAYQFNTPPPYDQGKGCGFLTKRPSLRAQEVLRRINA